MCALVTSLAMLLEVCACLTCLLYVDGASIHTTYTNKRIRKEKATVCSKVGQFLQHATNNCKYMVCDYAREPGNTHLVARELKCPPGVSTDPNSFTIYDENGNPATPCTVKSGQCTAQYLSSYDDIPVVNHYLQRPNGGNGQRTNHNGHNRIVHVKNHQSGLTQTHTTVHNPGAQGHGNKLSYITGANNYVIPPTMTFENVNAGAYAIPVNVVPSAHEQRPVSDIQISYERGTYPVSKIGSPSSYSTSKLPLSTYTINSPQHRHDVPSTGKTYPEIITYSSTKGHEYSHPQHNHGYPPAPISTGNGIPSHGAHAPTYNVYPSSQHGSPSSGNPAGPFIIRSSPYSTSVVHNPQDGQMYYPVSQDNMPPATSYGLANQNYNDDVYGGNTRNDNRQYSGKVIYLNNAGENAYDNEPEGHVYDSPYSVDQTPDDRNPDTYGPPPHDRGQPAHYVDSNHPGNGHHGNNPESKPPPKSSMLHTVFGPPPILSHEDAAGQHYPAPSGESSYHTPLGSMDKHHNPTIDDHYKHERRYHERKSYSEVKDVERYNENGLHHSPPTARQGQPLPPQNRSHPPNGDPHKSVAHNTVVHANVPNTPGVAGPNHLLSASDHSRNAPWRRYR